MSRALSVFFFLCSFSLALQPAVQMATTIKFKDDSGGEIRATLMGKVNNRPIALGAAESKYLAQVLKNLISDNVSSPVFGTTDDEKLTYNGFPLKLEGKGMPRSVRERILKTIAEDDSPRNYVVGSPSHENIAAMDVERLATYLDNLLPTIRDWAQRVALEGKKAMNSLEAINRGDTAGFSKMKSSLVKLSDLVYEEIEINSQLLENPNFKTLVNRYTIVQIDQQTRAEKHVFAQMRDTLITLSLKDSEGAPLYSPKAMQYVVDGLSNDCSPEMTSRPIKADPNEDAPYTAQLKRALDAAVEVKRALQSIP